MMKSIDDIRGLLTPDQNRAFEDIIWYINLLADPNHGSVLSDAEVLLDGIYHAIAFAPDLANNFVDTAKAVYMGIRSQKESNDE